MSTVAHNTVTYKMKMLRRRLILKANVCIQLWPVMFAPTFEKMLENQRFRRAKPFRVIEIHNIVTTVGKQLAADLLIAASSASLQYCGVGSSSQAESASDTDLVTPIGSRMLYVERSRTGAIAVLTFFYGKNDNIGTWRETGVFTAVSGGTMLARAVISPEISKTTSVTVRLDWDVEVA